jgi:hypothetical protein
MYIYVDIHDYLDFMIWNHNYIPVHIFNKLLTT